MASLWQGTAGEEEPNHGYPGSVGGAPAGRAGELAITGISGLILVGVNNQDWEVAARAFVGHTRTTYPNVTDATGATSIACGPYGMPETFVIDRAGRIRPRQMGAVTVETLVEADPAGPRGGIMRMFLALIPALGAAVEVTAAPPTEAQVDAVARELRCVVCQNLSVADSPSGMARQMREVIRERLAAAESPEQVKAYLASRYGEWVLLSPPTRGFPLLAWALQLGAPAGGLVGALLVLRRWSRRDGMTDEAEVDEEALAAVRRQLERRAS